MFSITVNPKLELRLLSYQDEEKFFNCIQRNRDYLEEFLPRINENQSSSDTRRVINIFLNQLVKDNGFRAGVFFENILIGVAGLKYIDWLNRKTEIMYWIDKEYTCRGIATDCVKKILDVSFNYYKLNKVILTSSYNNIGSKKIAEKCGFKLEGTLREDELLENGYCDTLQYSILKYEFNETN